MTHTGIPKKWCSTSSRSLKATSAPTQFIGKMEVTVEGGVNGTIDSAIKMVEHQIIQMLRAAHQLKCTSLSLHWDPKMITINSLQKVSPEFSSACDPENCNLPSVDRTGFRSDKRKLPSPF